MSAKTFKYKDLGDGCAEILRADEGVGLGVAERSVDVKAKRRDQPPRLPGRVKTLPVVEGAGVTAPGGGI